MVFSLLSRENLDFLLQLPHFLHLHSILILSMLTNNLISQLKPRHNCSFRNICKEKRRNLSVFYVTLVYRVTSGASFIIVMNLGTLNFLFSATSAFSCSRSFSIAIWAAVNSACFLLMISNQLQQIYSTSQKPRTQRYSRDYRSYCKERGQT